MSRRNGSSGQAETTSAVFGRVLARCREAAGLTQNQLAELVHVDRTVITRIEAGKHVPRQDFAVRCDKALNTGTLLSGLWEDIEWYPTNLDHPDWFRRRARMDAVAVAVREYQIGVIPGLLQTEEYAEALFSQVAEGDSVTDQVLARLSRQRRFLEPLEPESAPLLVVVLDESCIRRTVGDAAVMRGQFDQLLAVGTMPNVRIQVAPFSSAHLVPPNTSMSLITLPEKHPDGREWVYSESLDRGHLSDDPSIIRRHQRSYDLLRADALSARDSAALISEAREGHNDHDQPRSERGPLVQELLQRQQRRQLHRDSPRLHQRRRPRT